ncbi:hypothetical protein [Actinophytocola sp.]|uniref:hypothetical protein n=1 Tax=Actinophytocola sp. TaxID=1872138 RepID=UPI002ED985CE
MSPDKPDFATLRDDDYLLDRLGRGEPAAGDVERMLAGWRAGLPAAGPVDPRLLDAVTAAITAPGPAKRRRSAAKRRRPRRVARVSLSAAAAVLVAGGTVTIAAAYAGPSSPLWPVTRVMYGDLAESRAARDDADRAVSDAKTEADQGHYPEAARLLAVADSLADKVNEPTDEHRLRTDIATVRELLPALPPVAPGKSTASVEITPPALVPDAVPRTRNGAPDTRQDTERGSEQGSGGTGGGEGQPPTSTKAKKEKKAEANAVLPSVPTPEVDPSAPLDPGN